MSTRRLRWVTVRSEHAAGTARSRPTFERFLYRACVEDVPSGTRTVSIEGPVADFLGRRRHRRVVPGRSAFDDRGHLIARQLGGPDARANLVPMHFHTNQRGRWRDMEAEVLDLLGPGFGWMRVRVSYADGEVLRPARFTVELQCNRGGAKVWHIANFALYLQPGRDPR